jgi:hypothetical protein
VICTIKSSFLEAKPLIDHLHLACYKCEAVIEYTTPTFERLKREIAQQFRIGLIRLDVGGALSPYFLAKSTLSSSLACWRVFLRSLLKFLPARLM